MAETMVRQETVAEFGKDLGLIHEAVVTGRKWGAGREFWSKLAHDGELFAKTIAFVRRDGAELVREIVVSIPLTEAEKTAIAILGPGKVLTRAQARGETEFLLRYSEAVLQACAKENTEKGTDWRLVYLAGRSLRALEAEIGRDRRRQPCFDPDYLWWLKATEDSWATEEFEPGYYLIDFNGRFGVTAWARQDERVAELGPEFARAHEAMVSEAALRIFQVTGERLLAGWWHWGRSLTSDGCRVGVGGFGGHGWRVYSDRPSWVGADFLRVCLLRKFNLAA